MKGYELGKEGKSGIGYTIRSSHATNGRSAGIKEAEIAASSMLTQRNKRIITFKKLFSIFL